MHPLLRMFVANWWHQNPERQDLFGRWSQEPLIYIYAFKKYQRCSDSIWSSWKNGFCGENSGHLEVEATNMADTFMCDSMLMDTLGIRIYFLIAWIILT